MCEYSNNEFFSFLFFEYNLTVGVKSLINISISGWPACDDIAGSLLFLVKKRWDFKWTKCPLTGWYSVQYPEFIFRKTVGFWYSGVAIPIPDIKGRIISKLISSKIISQNWAFWLTKSKISFWHNQFRDDSAHIIFEDGPS